MTSYPLGSCSTAPSFPQTTKLRNKHTAKNILKRQSLKTGTCTDRVTNYHHRFAADKRKSKLDPCQSQPSSKAPKHASSIERNLFPDDPDEDTPMSVFLLAVNKSLRPRRRHSLLSKARRDHGSTHLSRVGLRWPGLIDPQVAAKQEPAGDVGTNRRSSIDMTNPRSSLDNGYLAYKLARTLNLQRKSLSEDNPAAVGGSHPGVSRLSRVSEHGQATQDDFPTAFRLRRCRSTRKSG